MASRQELIDTTGRLLWRQGLRATGMNQIVKESRAPRGSIYFHFPEGKEQLVTEALRSAGAIMTANIEQALSHRDAVTAIKRFVASYAKEMRDSDFHHGCPIATVALEAAATSPKIRVVCAAIFAEWEDLLAARLLADGFAKKEARNLALFILSSIEGAMILCRARRSTVPLASVGDQLTSLIESAR